MLETSDEICNLEVLSDDFDAVDIAKRHMVRVHGKKWKGAHVGGFDRIGEDDKKRAPGVVSKRMGV